MWNGAAETLKARPQIRKTRPNSTPVPAPGVHGGGDVGELRRAGEAVDQRGAVEQQARRQRAQHEILQARFRGLGVVAAEGGQDVERQRLQLDADIERDQVAGRGHHAHAERGQQRPGSGIRTGRAFSRPSQPSPSSTRHGAHADRWRPWRRPRPGRRRSRRRRRVPERADRGQDGGDQQARRRRAAETRTAPGVAVERADQQQHEGRDGEEELRQGQMQGAERSSSHQPPITAGRRRPAARPRRR